MAPLFWSTKKGHSPSTSVDTEQKHQDQDYPGVASVEHPDYGHGDALHVECPSHTTEGRLVMRVDRRLIPLLCILYLLAFLDRVNIANANVAGLSRDLKLAGDEYNTALVIFFVPYVLFEIPGNMLLKKLGPRVWLSLNMLLFGFTTVMQGVVQNYSGLLATRFFLGLFESAMFPGCFYLIGMWYCRDEAQKRYSFFFSSTTLAGAFGGLLAAAISKMDGVRGYAGWRWIFILEGAFTVLVAFVLFFCIPGFPEQAKWLSSDEQRYMVARLRADQGALNSAIDRPITLKDIGNVLKDYKVIVAGFMYLGLIVPAYAYAYFAPGIIKGYGYSPIEAQLHSVPPWAAAFVFTMILAALSDYTKHRCAYAVFSMTVGMVGFAILLSVHNHRNVEYAALFLVAMGTYAAGPIVACWLNMNLGGHQRRAVGGAWQVGFGNLGGFIAVFAFLAKDAPKYTSGYSICIAFTILGLVSCIVYAWACWRENRQRDKLTGDSGLTEHEKTMLGDKSPDYRYLL